MSPRLLISKLLYHFILVSVRRKQAVNFSGFIQFLVKPLKPQKYCCFSFIFRCDFLEVMSLFATSQVMLYIGFLKTSDCVLWFEDTACVCF